MVLFFIDHYDSFSANLQVWLRTGSIPIELEVVPFDDTPRMRALHRNPVPLVISPGPNSPAEAQNTQDLLRAQLGRAPILGVCLGMQLLGVIAGGRIVRALRPQHGQTKRIHCTDHRGLWVDMPATVAMATYNSLVVDRHSSLGPHWYRTATCDDGDLWGLEYRPPSGAWTFGVQFHPESFLSKRSEGLRENWLRYLAAFFG